MILTIYVTAFIINNMKITKSTKFILKYNNKEKQLLLEKLYNDYTEALKICIDLILTNKLPLKTLLSSSKIPVLGEIKHSQYKQIVYKNASEIIRSLLKTNQKIRYSRYKKVYKYFKEKGRQTKFINKKFSDLNLKIKWYKKPQLKNISIMLDNRRFDLQQGKEFDWFIRLGLPYFRENRKKAVYINLPFKEHKHSLQFKDWIKSNSVQLKKINNNFYLTVSYEKEVPQKESAQSIGIDIGVKKLITTSRNEFLGTEVEQIYDKLAKKLRGSKNYHQCLEYKRNKINQICNNLDLSEVSTVYVENLKRLRHKSKLSTKVLNKQQYWTYKQVLQKIEQRCLEQGIILVKVSPSYTSQTCSRCKIVDKTNRQGEVYVCKSCGLEIDADYNAAINILNRGTYSFSDTGKLEISQEL